MTDPILPYYQKELSYIRKLGKEFSEKHPDVAASLSLGAESCEDPHVERMIMAFAYLTGRVRAKLDDDFPELTESMLEVLYPHYLAPIPSMAIVQLDLDESQSNLVKGHSVPAGSVLESQPVEGERCRFRTSYDVTLWPIVLDGAWLRPLAAQDSKAPDGSAGTLRLILETLDPDISFEALDLESLRFFLHGQSRDMQSLYELLANDVTGVTVRDPDQKGTLSALSKDSLRPVGFAENEGVLPWSARSFFGYRTLTEYFAFPKKFHFFEIGGLGGGSRLGVGNRLEVCIYLSEHRTDLEGSVSKENFRFGCTPIVNLFSRRADPINLNHRKTEYPIIPDARRRRATEVYSIDRVTTLSPAGHEIDFKPFYSFQHGDDRNRVRTFWYARRHPSHEAEDGVSHGTEMAISLVDLDFVASEPADRTLHVQTTCTNRDLPQQLPFGGGQPKLSLVGADPLVEVRCLTAPTPTLRLPSGKGSQWRLISHLTLNHLSICDPDHRPDGLREILTLYDFMDSPETRAKIDSIKKIECRAIMRRTRGPVTAGFVRGVEVSLHMEAERFVDAGYFLFVSVIKEFLRLYCSINSFTQLRVLASGKEVVHTWEPGEKPLL